MDSDAIEKKERNNNTFKNTSVLYNGVKINIVDTQDMQTSEERLNVF